MKKNSLKRFKVIIAMALVLTLITGLIPNALFGMFSPMEVNAKSASLLVGQVDMYNEGDGGYWKDSESGIETADASNYNYYYDAINKTLTLNGASMMVNEYEYGIYSGLLNLKIVVKSGGAAMDNGSNSGYWSGIYAYGNLSIDIESGANFSIGSSVTSESRCGIRAAGNINITGSGTLTIYDDSEGILIQDGDLTIGGNSIVNIYDSNVEHSYKCGIHNDLGNVTVKDSAKVTINSGNIGIYAVGNVSIQDYAMVIITQSNFGIFAKAISLSSGIELLESKANDTSVAVANIIFKSFTDPDTNEDLITYVDGSDNAINYLKIGKRGNTNSNIDTLESGTPNVVEEGLNELFKNSLIYTNADALIVENGGTAEIKLIVKKNDSSPNASDVTNAATSDGKTIGMILDMSVFKTIKEANGTLVDGQSGEITDTGSLIKIEIPLPVELQSKANYVIYRHHGNGVDKITTTPNAEGEYIVVNEAKDTLTLFVKKFSTYAIAYDSNTSVKSGDNTPIMWLFSLIIITGSTVILSYRKIKRV